MPDKDNMDINEYDENGHTQLMNAAIVGDYDEVKRLLDLGADPDIVDRDWGTTKAENYAGRQSKNSEIHKKIEKLLIDSNPHSDKKTSNDFHLETRHKYENKKPSKIISFLMKLKRGWGMICRFLFIVSIGFIGYYWIDPQSIGDIPFSQLTLNLILKRLFAGLLILGCIVWFFRFPEKRYKEMIDEDDPYHIWADFSVLIGFLGFLILAWLLGK